MPVTHLTLCELNCLVKEVISSSFPDEYWVEAELSELRENAGNCYMELVEKKEGTNTPIAKASAKCWKSAWSSVRFHFERVTGQHLHSGLKVLLRVHAQFHENYGFSWIVTDIDPTFTLGDMARKRQEIINKLKAEGVFDLNKEIPFPLFTQRIAVISSATAAGYGDFCDQLKNNSYGFVFYPILFPAIMQGEKIEESIIGILNQINKRRDDFDCVVIIRGGGATSDLSGFDTLALAENVANFPLPVITGIGHERDESVLDMVSHTRVKTPTAAAAFLIDNLASVLKCIDDCGDRIVNSVKNRLTVELMRLDNISKRIPELFSVVKTRNESVLDGFLNRLTSAMRIKISNSNNRLDVFSSSIPQLVKNKLMSEHHRLDLLIQRVKALDPELTLRRGYSITLHNGFAVHDATKLRKGDKIETRLEKGLVRSVVED